MSFRENLLEKIRIKDLEQRIFASMGTVESGKRTDIDALRSLLAMGPYRHHRKRDLDLYVREGDADKYPIILLGNDLPMYLTTIEDVVLRRSPTIKEMISIRNAIKILNDTDIIWKKGHETLQEIKNACIERLDLSYEAADLFSIAEDGISSLEKCYHAGVIENLSLFGELLSYRLPPQKLSLRHYFMMGLFAEKSDGGTHFGPIVIYGEADNALKLIDGSVTAQHGGSIERVHQIAKGVVPASTEGAEVFNILMRSVLDAGH